MSVTVHTHTLPPGCHQVYIFNGGKYGDPIDTVGLFVPFKDGVELRGVHGTLSREINQQLARQAHELGYSKLYFRTPERQKRVSTLAVPCGKVDGMRLFFVDLENLFSETTAAASARPAPSNVIQGPWNKRPSSAPAARRYRMG
jgi:hypothetical protein